MIQDRIKQEFGWKPGKIVQNNGKKLPVPNMWDGACIGHLKPERYLIAKDKNDKKRLFVSFKKRGAWVLWI